MSTVIPSSKSEYLQFCDTHVDAWTANATAIGCTAAQILAWKNAYGEAKTAWNDALIARDAAKAATVTSDDAFALSRAATSEIVRIIKNYAIANPGGNVYALAQIPMPLPPSELPPPAQPTDLRATLNTDGSLTVRWKADNAKGVNGVVYLVRRRAGLTGAFEMVGAAGGRSFLDDTVPAGEAIIQYAITGQRGATMGAPSAVFTVFFGIASGGGMFIAKTEGGEEMGAAMKMAA